MYQKAFFGVQGQRPAPRRAPVLMRSVKTHTGLLLSKVTKPCMLYIVKKHDHDGDDEMGRISMPQGKGSQLHNRRDYAKIGKPVPDNINSALTAENIVLVDKNIKDAYHDIFGDAVAEYNAKQKRADRKIDDYYTHIQKSKNGEKIFYEDVLQWGAKSDFERPETRQKAAEALKAYVSTFEQRNSNLRLIGAYIHMDEASPHLHLDYIPVASGYKRGLALRNFPSHLLLFVLDRCNNSIITAFYARCLSS